MRSIARLLAVGALVALAFSAAATPAFAAATKASWSSVEVRLVNARDNTPGVLVQGQLPQTAKLPAEVSLSVPNGKAIDWAGEILGGDAANDPQATYTTKPANGYDEITFTLNQARSGQLEYVADDAVQPEGAGKKATLQWTSPADVPAVTLYIEVPTGGRISNPEGALSTQLSGSTFYYKQFSGVKKGQALKLSVSYTGGQFAPQQQPGQAQPGQAQPTGGGDNSIPLAVVALAGILGAMFFVMRRFSKPAMSCDAEPEPARKAPARARAAKSVGTATTEPQRDDDAFDPFSDAEG